MKIRYITAHGSAEWVEFDDRGRDNLTLAFEPYHNGAVVILDKIFPLKDGEVTIPFSVLADGEYAPRLESETGVFILESFIKQGKSLAVHYTDEDLIRRLIKRCYNLELAVYSLEERVGELERACHGHNIFDFERNKK